jgi:hypothetical protein
MNKLKLKIHIKLNSELNRPMMPLADTALTLLLACTLSSTVAQPDPTLA